MPSIKAATAIAACNQVFEIGQKRVLAQDRLILVMV